MDEKVTIGGVEYPVITASVVMPQGQITFSDGGKGSCFITATGPAYKKGDKFILRNGKYVGMDVALQTAEAKPAEAPKAGAEGKPAKAAKGKKEPKAK